METASWECETPEVLRISKVQTPVTSESCLQSFIVSPVSDLSFDERKPSPAASVDALRSLNTFIKVASRGDVSPVRSQLHIPVDEAAASTRRYYKRKCRQAVDTVLECIAPGQGGELLKEEPSKDPSKTCSSTDTLLQQLICLYEEATSWHTKLQILSHFACDYSKKRLRVMIPGLTIWRIDQARKHAKLAGPGKPVELPALKRSRLSMCKLEHFLEFISSPAYMQDVAYGTRSLKLSNGTKIEIPDVIRTVISSRLVCLYQTYCREVDFVPLGRSTLFSILQVILLCTTSILPCGRTL